MVLSCMCFMLTSGTALAKDQWLVFSLLVKDIILFSLTIGNCHN